MKYLLGFILIVTIALFFFIVIERKFISSITILFFLVSLSFLLIAFFAFLRLRYFIFECSGEVFNIKYHHPLLNNKLPTIELPLYKLISIYQKKQDLIFIIKSHKKNRHFKFHIQGISNYKIIQLQNLLNKTGDLSK